MAVLLTGGTGFVGLSLAEALAARGCEPVLFAPDGIPDRFAGLGPFGGIRRTTGDVRCEADLARALEDGITEVVHLAAVTPGPEREAREPASVVGVNVGGTVALVQAAAAAGVRRVVVLSSVAAYGDAAPGDDGRLHEDACPRPSSLYGITKLAAEQAALRLGDVHGLDVRAVRLGPVFGPWERASGVRDRLSPHAQVLALAAEGRPVVLPHALEADWLYSRDAGEGIAAVLATPDLTSRVVNLGGGAVTSVAHWCDMVCRDAGWRIAGPDEPATVRISLPRSRPPLANDRIAAETGFRHRYLLAEAAADHLVWLGRVGGAGSRGPA